MDPLWISLQTAGIATALIFIVAVLAARVRLGLPRGAGFALDFLFLLPLFLPMGAIIYGLRTLGVLAATLWCGHQTLNCLLLLAMHSAAAAPFVYFCARMGFRKTGPELIEAARMQGLGACGIFCRVQIPLGWRWLAAGLILGLLRAFGESIFTLLPCVGR